MVWISSPKEGQVKKNSLPGVGPGCDGTFLYLLVPVNAILGIAAPKIVIVVLVLV